MPETPERLKVLIVAPYLNGEGLGEVYSIFKWVEALCARADVTILTISGDDRLGAFLPSAEIVCWRSPRTPLRLRRFVHMAKPWLPYFFARARRWIKHAQRDGRRWDVAHQILPQAMRYASPLRGLGIPHVIGPLGGSLETPPAFAPEVDDGAAWTRLRKLDRWRLAHDRRLRSGYEDADIVLGVAPYVRDILAEAGIRLKRFEPILERSHDGTFPDVSREAVADRATLLHVGRVVRTKALRDVIRALARLGDLPDVRLISAGDGPDLAACRAEAETLGLADRVTFLGLVPRDAVDRLYAEADIFCFPSFREPMGGVFFEAMSYGLPVIAAARGGPDFILDDTCAIRLPVETPDQFASDIAEAIRALVRDPARRLRLGAGAVAHMRAIGSWSDKADRLDGIYRDAVRARVARSGRSG